MLYTSISLFALTAILGIIILFRWLMKQNASKSVVYAHGIFVAAGLAEHLCVASRGIHDTQSNTVTAHYSGKFKDPDVQRNFLSYLKY